MHLALHNNGQKMVEKTIDWEKMFNFKFTVMRNADLQNSIVFRFKIWFNIIETSEANLGYYLINFCLLISFQANVLFLYQSIEV